MTEDRVPTYRLCTECGWQARVDREYHPYAACLIYKASGNDPLMVLRQIASDVATLNDKGQFPVARAEYARLGSAPSRSGEPSIADLTLERSQSKHAAWCLLPDDHEGPCDGDQ